MVLYDTVNFSKVTFESFEIDKILFIAFRVKLRLKKILSALIFALRSFFKTDEF